MKPFRRVVLTAAMTLLLACPATAGPERAAETAPQRAATQPARSPTPRPKFVLGPASKTHGVSPAIESLLSDVAQPAKLRAGTQGSCHDHTSVDAKIAACEKDVAGGRALVVWDWSSASCARKPCVRDVDGFHLWRASSSAATGSVAATIAAPSSYYVFAERAKDIVGSCFRVSAYKGKSDGPHSASYCATAPPPTSATVKLQTDYSYTTVYHGKWQWHPPNSDTAPCAGIGYVYPPLPKVSGAFAVGNRNGISMAGTGDPTLPCADDQYLYRTAIQFALTGLHGKKIDTALLHLDVVSGLYDQGGGELRSTRSCADAIGLPANDRWTAGHPVDEKEWPGLQAFTELSTWKASMSPPKIELTKVVQEWIDGKRANDGVVLSGLGINATTRIGQPGNRTNSSCVSFYKATLEITYRP